MKNKMNITVVGLGYVGLSNALLLARKNNVTALEIDETKINLINKRISPIKDTEIENYLQNLDIRLNLTNKKEEAYKNSEIVIIATPTNYDTESNKFDTTSVENTIKDSIQYGKNPLICIKSTIPVGFTENIKKKFNYERIIFSPEFLREGQALHDNLYPSRIIVGDLSNDGKLISNILAESALKKEIPILLTSSTEAEAIKLFSNTYLAMRVAYFNELDTYASSQLLNTERIIKGVCLDPRIGEHYNNPSFGYGGYCLPKDTKQLLANYNGIPQNLISAIVESNKTRKKFICQEIIKLNPKTIGIYRLSMKTGSDNFRESSIIDIMKNLSSYGFDIKIYEPQLTSNVFLGFDVIDNLTEFKKSSDVILCNRVSADIKDSLHKVYTRDFFHYD